MFVTDVEAATGINRKINFQGKVVNKGVGGTDGTNITDGNYNFTFSLWTTLSAGSSIWSETWSGGSQVAVTAGIFQVALGTISTFPPSVDFNTDSLYVSVNFNGDGDMTPRIQMAAVPYAFNAEKVSGLTIIGTGVSLDQNLKTTDSPTFATAKFTNVTVGSGTTILYIDSAGNLVQGTLPPGGSYTATNGLNLAGSAFGLGGTLVNLTKIDQGGYTFGFFGTGGIGIGNTDPGLFKLNVGGSMVSTDNFATNMFTTKIGIGTSTAGVYSLSAGGTVAVTDLIIGGKVGLGTSTPGLYKLNVGGTANFVNLNTTSSISIGGSVVFSNLAIGTGTSILYINATGNLVSGTLPVGGQAYTATNGLNLAGSAFGLGGTISTLTRVNIGTGSSGLLFLGVGETQGLFLSETGAVLIGTTNPFIKHGLYVETHDTTTSSGINVVNTLGTGRIEVQADSDLSMISWGVGSSQAGIVELETDEAYVEMRIKSIPNIPITFINNNLERMRINTGGNIGIGTTNPLFKLQVVGDASISTNLGIGGSLTLTGIAAGVGTSMLYIGADGNIIAGVLPSSSGVNSKVIVLSPEYSGASLSADGSGTTDVSMTSDNVLNVGGSGWKNFYQLSSTNGALQDYSIIVRVTLPTDFGAWETGNCPGTTCALELNYQTGVGTTNDNNVSYIVSNDVDTPGTAVCSVGVSASTVWNTSGCTEATLNDGGAPEWDAAGESAVIRIKMAAKNTPGALSRIGDIILRYRSTF